MEVLRGALRSLERTAIVAQGSSYSYAKLLSNALDIAKSLESLPAKVPQVAFPQHAASQPRVALMAEPGAAYAAGTMGTWLNRGISVPLCLSHPDRELSYVLEDSGASAVLATPTHVERMYRIAQPFDTQVIEIDVKHDPESSQGSHQLISSLLSSLCEEDGALIVYTSGTTGRPKGALHTYKSLDAQINALCTAWEWSNSDRILHALPLHHVHGIVNALYCPLATGATVEMMPKFSPKEVWQRLTRIEDPITIFMGVPTMYSFLLNAYSQASSEAEKEAYKAASRSLRVAISGSAACPVPIMNAWRDLSGVYLLERFGMTETGMVLGNPLHGSRRPGTVGVPFPGNIVRLDPSTGELSVKSDQLFAGYWGRPEATANSFDSDGYFLTGDTAEREDLTNGGYYKLLGRTSVDIIKSGGYKISALEIESVLLEHPALAECAVVGLPDAEYGEQVAVVAALKESYKNNAPTIEELAAWAKGRLAPYQVPRVLRVLPGEIPRNAMGKVNKKTLKAQVFGNDAASA